MASDSSLGGAGPAASGVMLEPGPAAQQGTIAKTKQPTANSSQKQWLACCMRATEITAPNRDEHCVTFHCQWGCLRTCRRAGRRIWRAGKAQALQSVR